MNEIKNDKNLQEAVNRRERELPPMPADLNERLMESLTSSKENGSYPHSSSLSLWRGRGVKLSLLAIAASIALLIIFYKGKEQAPQEPLMAQQTTAKPTATPSQPIVEEEQEKEEAATVQQPKAKPVEENTEEASEAETQTTAPASTENAKGTRRPHAHPVPDFTSRKDEQHFLASTSYMVKHRSHRSNLAESTEAEGGSATPFPTKMTEQERPQIPSAKDMYHRLTEKERKQMDVLGAINAKQWRIDVSMMNTMRYGSRMVTPDFYLELRGDTLRSYLPYLGQAQVSPMLSPSIGLNFEEPVRQYKESKPKSKKYTQIDIDVRTREDNYHYVIELYDSGEATIRVRSLNRDPISFDGTLIIE